ncbi:hypothetical protein G4313_11390 [Coprococcus eutactus]|nr:hypothetical protein [Coprococcus eutactus]
MADVKWIKITTGMFDNRKIKHLRKLPDGNNIVLIWIMLLTMAGKCNSDGRIFLTEDIPYTTKMLADELGFKENIVKQAILSLEQLGMIIRSGDFITVAGWQEHQNTEGMDKIRESKRMAQSRWRDKQKAKKSTVDGIVESTVDSTVDSTRCLVDDAEEEREEDKERDKREIKEVEEKKIDYDRIVQMYNAHCPSLPAVKCLSDARKKAIKARLNHYTFDDFEEMFKKAESSDFLKGKNNRNWIATFDWLLKDTNMAKVLDDNYANTAPTAKTNYSGNNRVADQLNESYKMMAEWANERAEKGGFADDERDG